MKLPYPPKPSKVEIRLKNFFIHYCMNFNHKIFVTKALYNRVQILAFLGITWFGWSPNRIILLLLFIISCEFTCSIAMFKKYLSYSLIRPRGEADGIMQTKRDCAWTKKYKIENTQYPFIYLYPVYSICFIYTNMPINL